MAIGGAYLEGGKCDGQYVILSDADNTAGSTTCEGGLYKATHPARYHDGVLVFKYAGKAPAQTGSQGLKAPQALGGWKALQKSINRDMPRALRYSQHITAGALRTLSRARKVRL